MDICIKTYNGENMTDIIIDEKTSIDLDMSINSIDQANINSLQDLNIKPFDKVRVLWNDNIIFSGICVDAAMNVSVGQLNYSYTINSPLFLLQKTNIENSHTSNLQLFLKKCCDICEIGLDYRLSTNPVIAVEETDYFSMLRKSVIYTKNNNTRFYMDYENNKLILDEHDKDLKAD